MKQQNNLAYYQYIPTPIKELDKRRQLEEEEGIQIVDAAADSLEDIGADGIITDNLEAATDKNVPKEKDEQQSKHIMGSILGPNRVIAKEVVLTAVLSDECY